MGLNYTCKRWGKNILHGYKSKTVIHKHVITIYINRKPYVENQMTPSHLILSDVERSSLGHLDFEALYLVLKQSCSYVICHTLVLSINRKKYMASPLRRLYLT